MRPAAAVAGLLAASTLLAASARPDLAPPPAPDWQSVSRPSTDLLGVLAVEDARAPVPDDVRTLLTVARSGRGAVQRAAIRALGRLERRELIAELVPYLRSGDLAVRDEAASAIAMAMRGPALAAPSAEEQTRTAFEALALSSVDAGGFRALGRLPEPLARTTSIAPRRSSCEAIRSAVPNAGAPRGLESLARLNRKLLPFDDLHARSTARDRDQPRSDVRRRSTPQRHGRADGGGRRGHCHGDGRARRTTTPRSAAWRCSSLAGAGLAIDDDRRVDLLRSGSPTARRWCGSRRSRAGSAAAWPRTAAAACSTRSPTTIRTSSLYALDALGDQCKDDISITDRLTAEARTPPDSRAWQREAHAFVSLAKRAPDRAALAMPAFAMHQAGRCACMPPARRRPMNDAATLAPLGDGRRRQRREAALPAAAPAARCGERRVVRSAALQRTDYQLLRTAGARVEGQRAVAGAGQRARRGSRAGHRREEGHFARHAHGAHRAAGRARLRRAKAAALRPLLRDFDPVVATAAATLLRRGRARTSTVQPQPLPLPPIPTADELAEDVQAVVTMESGRRFDLAVR